MLLPGTPKAESSYETRCRTPIRDAMLPAVRPPRHQSRWAEMIRQPADPGPRFFGGPWLFASTMGVADRSEEPSHELPKQAGKPLNLNPVTVSIGAGPAHLRAHGSCSRRCASSARHVAHFQPGRTSCSASQTSPSVSDQQRDPAARPESTVQALQQTYLAWHKGHSWINTATCRRRTSVA